MSNSDHKPVLVTGASQGIGRAIAIELSKAGYQVFGTYLTHEAEAQELAKDYGVSFFKVDLADRREVLELTKRLDGLDLYGLVNNAGTFDMATLEELDFDGWEHTLQVNVTAPLILSQKLSSHMVRGGSIINIASTDGFAAAFDTIAYAASKAALISITKSLGANLGPKGIRANAIAPGWVDTSMAYELPAGVVEEVTPLGRQGTPEEIAQAVGFLLSESASYINGTTLVIDGGLSNIDYTLKKESQKNSGDSAAALASPATDKPSDSASTVSAPANLSNSAPAPADSFSDTPPEAPAA